MIHVKVTFNKSLTERLFRDYFLYERKKLFRQMPTAVMLVISLGFMLIGYFVSVPFLVYMGISTVIIVIVAVLFYYLKFKIAFERFLKGLEKYADENPTQHIFEFNEEKIVYRSELHKNEMKWEAINSYVENNGVIYLYHKKNSLLDIYSPEIMGEENFKIFESMVTSKTQQK